MTLADDIATDLADHGSSSAWVDSAEEAAEWRRVTRAAAKQLGRPVRTYGFDLYPQHHVHAEIRDFPRDEAESERKESYLNRAMEAARPAILAAQRSRVGPLSRM